MPPPASGHTAEAARPGGHSAAAGTPAALPRVRVSRRVEFSAAHHLRIPHAPEESQRIFGDLATPPGHGHNYEVWVTVDSPVDPVTGFGVNVATLKAILLEEVVHPFDGRDLATEVPELATRPATMESVALAIWSRMTRRTGEATLACVRVSEHPRLWAEYKGESDDMQPHAAPHATLTRAVEISAAHRLSSDALTEEENRSLYGKCANPHGHGHNYRIEVTVQGTVDSRTGTLIDLGLLDRAIDTQVMGRLDHKHLDLDVPEFRGRVSTGENIALVVWDLLVDALPAGALETVRVIETSNNAFEYSGGRR